MLAIDEGLYIISKFFLKISKVTREVPATHGLASPLAKSARSFSTSRAMETKFFSIACLCSRSSAFAFFSNSKAVLKQNKQLKKKKEGTNKNNFKIFNIHVFGAYLDGFYRRGILGYIATNSFCTMSLTVLHCCIVGESTLSPSSCLTVVNGIKTIVVGQS